MNSTLKQTQKLLKQLKQRKFSSQISKNVGQFDINSQNGDKTDEYNGGFLCSYHTGQLITNFCIREGEDRPKPLCPKCLQQHMKSHQERSTICRLQTCQSQNNKIQQFLRQKLSNCSALNDKILTLNQWKAESMSLIKSELKKFKDQIQQSIESLFQELQSEIVCKYKEQNKSYERLTTIVESSISDLKQICQTSVDLLKRKKELNIIVLSLSQITEKGQAIMINEKKILENSLLNCEVKVNKSKISQIINCVKNSIEFKLDKISQFQLERRLQRIKTQLKQKQQLFKQQNTRLKLQKIPYHKSTNKLQTIDTYKTHKQPFYQKQKSQTNFYDTFSSFRSKQNSKTSTITHKNTQNQKQRMWDKLNETSNKLKSSLNLMARKSNRKAYQ